MKFLCDVHISFKLVKHLISMGFESTHVNEISDKWCTTDKNICRFADDNNLIVITKDSDFRNSFYIHKTPKKLVKINLGNISNLDLIRIITENLEYIEKLNGFPEFIIEIDKDLIQFNVLDNK